jgi:hypothetical protein
MLARHVRCTFKSGRRQAAPAGPFRARSRLAGARLASLDDRAKDRSRERGCDADCS